jgi:hypothetical protein
MRKEFTTTAALIAAVAAGWLWYNPVAGQVSSVETKAQPAAGWEPPRTTWGHPDLQGVWDPTTGTPLERPPEYKDREFLTDEEAAERERTRFAQFDSPDRGPQNRTGDYGSVWREGSKNALNRTSLIVDPPDGRLPPLTPAARQAAAARQAERRSRGPADDWTDLSLWTRCVTRGTPRIPNNYNSNLHIVQVPERVTIYYEMIHETRTVWLDGRPHLTPNIRLWNGDSRGHWEGTTLVVETTNFNDKQQFNGLSMSTATLIERFTRTAPDQIDYRFTIDDPSTYSRPFTVTEPMVRNSAPYYEYACHEGNYGLRNILAGARAEEKEGRKATGRYGDEGTANEQPTGR